MHSVTAKLNKAAREHPNQAGITFFVSLGEKNYDYKSKQAVWTNYDAALFAKDAQIDFYRSVLVEGAVIEVSGTGIIMDASDPSYKPKLILQDAKLGFTHGGQPQQANQAPGVPQYAGQQPRMPGPEEYHQQSQRPAPPQQPQGNFQAPVDDFDDDIPF